MNTLKAPKLKTAGSLLVALLMGCASTPDIEFHELALPANQRQNQDKSFDLPFNAYVVGIEKENSSQAGSIKECETSQQDGRCLNINSKFYAGSEALKNEIRGIYADQHRPTFVSHVARFSMNETSNPCFLYNRAVPK